MNWEVIAYGSGDFLRMVFTAVASIFGNAHYLGAIQAAFFIGFLTMLARSAITHDVMTGTRWFAAALVLNLALIVPKTTVVITDRVLPTNSAVVNNVPLGLAATAGLFSYTGDWFSRAFETVFTVPGAMRYTENGLLFGHKVLEASRTMVISDERIYLNFTEFFSSCVVVDGVGHGRFSWEDVLEANDLLAFFGAHVAVHAARFKYTTTAGVDRILPCRSGFVGSLQPELTALTDNIMNTGIRGFIANADTAATALTKFKTDLPPAIQYLTGITITPQTLVLQTALSNTMGNAMLRMAQSLQDSAFVAQYARQWAENERRTTYQTMGRIAEEKLPLLRALIEAFLYAIFPIIVLTALILPTAVPFTYVTALFWINLWPPLYAILNFFISYYSQGVLTELSRLHGSGFNAMANTQLTEYVSDMVATSGYLVSSLPIISWMLVSRSGALAAMFASRIMQGYDASVAGAAEQLTRGEGQMGGVHFRQTNEHGGFGPTPQGVLAPDNNVLTDTVTRSGSGLVIAGGGEPFVEQRQSHSPVGVSLAQELTAHTSQDLIHAHTDVEHSRESWSESTTRLGTTVGALINTTGEHTAHGRNISETEGSVHEALTKETRHAVDEWATHNALRLSNDEKAGIVGSVQTKLGVNLGPAGVATAGSLNVGSEEMRSRSDIQAYADKFMMTDEYGTALRTTAGYAVEHSENVTDTEGRQFSHTIGNSLAEQQSRQTQYDTAKTNVETAQEHHQQALAFKEHVSVAGLDAMKQHAIHERAMTPAAFDQLLIDVRNGDYTATQAMLHMTETLRQQGTWPLVGHETGPLSEQFLPAETLERPGIDPAQAHKDNAILAEFDVHNPGFRPETVQDQIDDDKATVQDTTATAVAAEAHHHDDQRNPGLDHPVVMHEGVLDPVQTAGRDTLDVAEAVVSGPWTITDEAAAALGSHGGYQGGPLFGTGRENVHPSLRGAPGMDQEHAALTHGGGGGADAAAREGPDVGASTPPLDQGFWPSESSAPDRPAADTPGAGMRVDLGLAAEADSEAPGSGAAFAAEPSSLPGGKDLSSGPSAALEQDSSIPHQDAGVGADEAPSPAQGVDLSHHSPAQDEALAGGLQAFPSDKEPGPATGSVVNPGGPALSPDGPSIEPDPPAPVPDEPAPGIAGDAPSLNPEPATGQDDTTLAAGVGPAGDVSTPPPEPPAFHGLARPDPEIPGPRAPDMTLSGSPPIAAGLSSGAVEHGTAALHTTSAQASPDVLLDPTGLAAPIAPDRASPEPFRAREPLTPFASPDEGLASPGIESAPPVVRAGIGDQESRPILRPPHDAGTGHTQTLVSIMGHEALRLEPYPDKGGMAIGYGHNLVTNGDTFADGTPIPDTLTREQAERLLREDIAEAERNARTLVGDEHWEALSEVRQGVMIELAYQHGYENTREFEQFLDAVEKEDWQRGAGELLDSETFKKIAPERMATLATRFANDEWTQGLQ